MLVSAWVKLNVSLAMIDGVNCQNIWVIYQSISDGNQ